MKTKYLILSVASLFAFSVGCTDMDLTPEGSTVTTETKEDVGELLPERFEAGVNAVVASFSTSMLTWPDAERHNDFGYPAVMMFMDANGYDFVSDDNGYNWMGNCLTYTDRVYTSYESGITWGTMYRQIFAANAVLGSIGTTEPEDDDLKYYAGQALAIRAFDYWVLAQLYQFNYADHKSDLCVPIITEENAETAAIEGAARSTVEEVYAQIMSDINAAIACLEATSMSRSTNNYVSLEVAYGIRARVNLTMENWADAASDAAAAQAYGAPASFAFVSEPTFNDLTDFMWGISIAETDEVVTTGICNWPSHMGSLNWGYCWYSGGMQVSKALFDAIPESDARKGWWIDANCESPNLTDYQQYIMRDYVEYVPYTHVKFAPYKDEIATSTNANPIPLMRVEEMYLIQAEALAMSGDVAGGKAVLESFVQTYRNPSYTCDATTAEEVQEAVYFQRRIEFWGEGLAWFDIMRLNKNVDRRGAYFPQGTSVYNIEAGSDILLWRLPESEITANALISESDNNKSASSPDVVADYDYPDME